MAGSPVPLSGYAVIKRMRANAWGRVSLKYPARANFWASTVSAVPLPCLRSSLAKYSWPSLFWRKKSTAASEKAHLSWGVAKLLAREPVPFAGGLFGAFDQATVRDKVLHAREAGDVLDLIQDHQGQDLAERNRVRSFFLH